MERKTHINENWKHDEDFSAFAERLKTYPYAKDSDIGLVLSVLYSNVGGAWAEAIVADFLKHVPDIPLRTQIVRKVGDPAQVLADLVKGGKITMEDIR